MQMEADASRLDSGHSAAPRAKSRSGPVCHELPRRQVNCGRFQPSITMKRFPSSLRAERGPQKPGDKVCWGVRASRLARSQTVLVNNGLRERLIFFGFILCRVFHALSSRLHPNITNIQRLCQHADFFHLSHTRRTFHANWG